MQDLTTGPILTLHIFLPPHSVSLPIARHINDTVLWGFVLLSVMFALSGIVRATGAVWPPLAILIVAMFAIRIPFAELLIPRYGADAIWWSFPLGAIAASGLTALYYRFVNWRATRWSRTSDRPGMRPMPAWRRRPCPNRRSH